MQTEWNGFLRWKRCNVTKVKRRRDKLSPKLLTPTRFRYRCAHVESDLQPQLRLTLAPPHPTRFIVLLSPRSHFSAVASETIILSKPTEKTVNAATILLPKFYEWNISLQKDPKLKWFSHQSLLLLQLSVTLDLWSNLIIIWWIK